MVNWEVNGVGGAVSDFMLNRLHYPCLYRRKALDKKGAEPGANVGWVSTKSTKRTALDHVADGMSSGRVKIKSKRLLEEARSFIVYEGGGVGQAKLADRDTDAREAHGDRVMAAAMAVMLMPQAAKMTAQDAKLRAVENDLSTPHGRWVQRQRDKINEDYARPSWRD